MKLNITPGPWSARRPEDSNGYTYVDGKDSTQGRTSTCYNGEEFPDDATAIVTAVNNTYHKGINPEAVEELLQVTKALYKQNLLSAEAQENLNRIIQKATL